MSDQVITAEAVAKFTPKNAPVKITLNNDALEPGKVIRGWFQGVVPNPKLNPMVLSQTNGWHWVAEVVDAHSDNHLWAIHLGAIREITVVPPYKVRP